MFKNALNSFQGTAQRRERFFNKTKVIAQNIGTMI